MTEKETGNQSLSDFLEEHYQLFAIMGIFGTVTVLFAQQWPANSGNEITRMGTVAGLAIFGMTALLISRLCWAEFSDISERQPQLSDAGYSIILVCTAALGISVVGALSEYIFETQIILELAITVIEILLFAHYFPTARYRDPIEEYDINPDSLLLLSFIGLMFLYPSLKIGVPRFMQSIDLGFLYLAHIFAIGSLLFITICEGILGIVIIWKQRSDISPEKIASDWPMSASLSICFISIIFLSIYTGEMASSHQVRIQGYFEINGTHWAHFLFKKWMLLAGVTIVSLWYKPRAVSQEKAKKLIQMISIIIALSFLLDSYYVYLEGGHLIPI